MPPPSVLQSFPHQKYPCDLKVWRKTESFFVNCICLFQHFHSFFMHLYTLCGVFCIFRYFEICYVDWFYLCIIIIFKTYLFMTTIHAISKSINFLSNRIYEVSSILRDIFNGISYNCSFQRNFPTFQLTDNFVGVDFMHPKIFLKAAYWFLANCLLVRLIF